VGENVVSTSFTQSRGVDPVLLSGSSERAYVKNNVGNHGKVRGKRIYGTGCASHARGQESRDRCPFMLLVEIHGR